MMILKARGMGVKRAFVIACQSKLGYLSLPLHLGSNNSAQHAKYWIKDNVHQNAQSGA
jgi:hypothetical protein